VAFEDRAEEKIRLMFARARELGIEVRGNGLSALRHDAGYRKAGAVRAIYFGK
jgi:hypothetical protein